MHSVHAQNVDNHIGIFEEALEARYNITPELFNETEFFARAEKFYHTQLSIYKAQSKQMNALEETLHGIQTLAVRQTALIEKLRETLQLVDEQCCENSKELIGRANATAKDHH